MIPILEINEQGNISTLYNDQIDLFSLGIVYNIKRATNIEFDEINQCWNVISCKSNETVYKNKNREKAIEWEIEMFSPGGYYYNV